MSWLNKEKCLRSRGNLVYYVFRSKKLRERQYKEGYARFLDGKGVEWDGDDNVSIYGTGEMGND